MLVSGLFTPQKTLLEAFLWVDFLLPQLFFLQAEKGPRVPLGQERGDTSQQRPNKRAGVSNTALTSSSGAPQARSSLLGGQPSLRARSCQHHHPSLSLLGRWRRTGILQDGCSPWAAKCRLSSEMPAPVLPFCLLNFQVLEGLIAKLWISCRLAGRKVGGTRSSLAM